MKRGTMDVAMSRNGKRLLAVFFGLVIVFLYLPTVLLLLFSFNNSTVIAFPITDLTTGFYEAAWQDDEIARSASASYDDVELAPGALVDPFELFPLGKEALRARLGVLTRGQLLTIIATYDLNPAGLALGRLSASQLVTFIVTAAETQMLQGRH